MESDCLDSCGELLDLVLKPAFNLGGLLEGDCGELFDLVLEVFGVLGVEDFGEDGLEVFGVEGLVDAFDVEDLKAFFNASDVVTSLSPINNIE